MPEIALRSAHPPTAVGIVSVSGRQAGIIFIVARRCMVIIAVLVDTEFSRNHGIVSTSDFMSSHPPAWHAGVVNAGCHTPVLPSRPDEDRLSTPRSQFRGSAVRARKTALRGCFLRILRIEKPDSGCTTVLIPVCRRSHKIVNGRILYAFLSVRRWLFPYILTVYFAEVVIIAVI